MASGSCHRKPLAHSRAHRVQHKVWDLNTLHLVVNVSQFNSVQLFHSKSLWKPTQLRLSWQAQQFLRTINNAFTGNREVKFRLFKYKAFYFFSSYRLFSPSYLLLFLSLENTVATVHLKTCWKVQKQLKCCFTGNVQCYFTISSHKGNKSSFKLFTIPQRATGGPSVPHIDHTYSLNISCHA